MVTKKTFDLIIIVVALAHPAFGLVKMEGRRLARESSSPIMSRLGDALTITL